MSELVRVVLLGSSPRHTLGTIYWSEESSNGSKKVAWIGRMEGI